MVGVAAVVAEADVSALGLVAEVALIVFQEIVRGIYKEFFRPVFKVFGEVTLVKI